MLLVSIVGVGGLAYAGFLDQSYLKIQGRRLADIYMPTVLTAEKERALKRGDRFQECASCPEMVVVPAGEFMMGGQFEQPIRKLAFRNPFAVSKFEVTLDEWDACVAHRACTNRPGHNSWERGRQPVINVSWDDAKAYVTWLAKRTGKPYRLLTEVEWEYAARARSTTRYSFGDDEAALGQHAWYARNSNSQAHPVGEKTPNAFGLFDMHGNVWEWVEDCTDDSAVSSSDCSSRVLRGGSWNNNPDRLRSAHRSRNIPGNRGYDVGFRVARTLSLIIPLHHGSRAKP